jgi:hypothetical protein
MSARAVNMYYSFTNSYRIRKCQPNHSAIHKPSKNNCKTIADKQPIIKNIEIDDEL